MDLYRVDLASVINKYIGETEKNLHRVLARAEELDIILLLDEGDSLLGQRTDVKSSNDRYANLETNYLLQRLENYQGIVLITTNAAQNIDTAFQRRMDVVVDFVPPQADERWAIWQLHMPDDCAVRADFLARVAAQCALTGGQIRNAALLSTLLAVSDGSGRVRNRHLDAAVRAEYRKAGAVCPLEENGAARMPASQLDQFIRVIAPA
jgi:SpoVK/Ycf46/Vps4 family AAA+-type ATPase